MKIFDTHAHYDDDKFDGIRDELLTEVFSNDVEKIVNIGASLESSLASIELSKKYPNIYAAVGVHPENVTTDMTDGWIDRVEKMYRENEKVVAIGEIGLDYYWTTDTVEMQKECFRKQLDLATKLNAPVVIHDRDAHGDSLEIIKEYPNVTAVFHAFSGSCEMAKDLFKHGHYISFGGVVTFKNARKTVEIVENLISLHPEAMNRILLETDAPYLTPVPHRGEMNRSDYIKFVAEKCGEILGMSADEFCEICYNNAMRFYNIG